jgi:hypothetical protein
MVRIWAGSVIGKESTAKVAELWEGTKGIFCIADIYMGRWETRAWGHVNEGEVGKAR